MSDEKFGLFTVNEKICKLDYLSSRYRFFTTTSILFTSLTFVRFSYEIYKIEHLLSRKNKNLVYSLYLLRTQLFVIDRFFITVSSADG